jgi:hypothetical protein
MPCVAESGGKFPKTEYGWNSGTCQIVVLSKSLISIGHLVMHVNKMPKVTAAQGFLPSTAKNARLTGQIRVLSVETILGPSAPSPPNSLASNFPLCEHPPGRQRLGADNIASFHSIDDGFCVFDFW